MKKKIILALLIGTMVFSLCSCGEKNHHDGKCDICDKKATYSGDGEEYCDKHLKDAIEWYLEQGQD